jgi:hypothetical protein
MLLPWSLILASGSPLKLNFGQSTLSLADSCQWVNVWFCLRQAQAPDYIRQKLNEHEVPEGAAPGVLIRSDRKALDFSGWRSITLLRNLSVTRYFLAFTGSWYSKIVWRRFSKNID